MAQKKGLGRGLNTLIPGADGEGSVRKPVKRTVKTSAAATGETTVSKEDKESSTKTGNTKSTGTKTKSTKTGTKKNTAKKEDTAEKLEIYVSIDQVEPNRNQPRKQFNDDSIEELSDSIKQYGILQPILVKKQDDYYEIIAGERRWRAAKKAGLKEVPIIIKDLGKDDILKISLIENLQREDLNPIEEAKAYQMLQEELGLKHDEIASSVSKSRATITNTMRLLNLAEEVQKMIIEGIISHGHGRTLLAIEDPAVQYEVAEKILDENMSVRETEKYIKKLLSEKNKNKEPAEVNPQLQEMIQFFEVRMKDILGSKVQIKDKKNNKGKIEIEYYSHEELERIIDMIQSIKG